ncbi:MAG: copper-translocating P-type ATPase [bacterium]|nr:copper-translocating P-type ATPase [bacterium]
MKDHNHEDHAEHDHDQGEHEGHGGHGDHHRQMIQDFKKRLAVSAVLTVPILLLSPMIQSFFGISFGFPGSRFVLFALSSLVFVYGGWPFLRGTFDEVRQANPGMMTLIGLAIFVAYAYSSAVVFGLAGKMFFWELATLIDIMLLGHWIEMRSVLGASRALELLVEMMPNEAHRIGEDGDVNDIALEDVQSGDLLLIKPGEKIPADGAIEDGDSYLNESMLTGESEPVRKSAGGEVIGGSVNGEGSLRIRVNKTGEDSYLSKVIRLVEEAQQTKSRTQRLADRAARWLTFVALTAGALTLAVWLYLGYEFVFALERMVTVMVISCPHALGLAIPLVAAISTALSAQHGLLIRNRTAFESARKISTIVFDKTGTLTTGEFGVQRIVSVADSFSEDDVLRFAGALEENSEHPIALAIVRACENKGLSVPAASGFQSITGKGVQASVDSREVKVVSPGFLKENDLAIPDAAAASGAETVVFLVVDAELRGFIGLADSIRSESPEAIRILHEAGIKTMMATGDNETVAKSVHDELGLNGFYASVLPHEKQDIVKDLQSEGEFVAMTGDGVNDAPALAQADVGIAVGSGTDVAAETADIVLVHSNPKDISNLVLFGRATHRKMIQNLIWATAYNVVAIPLAAGVLAPLGIMLSPAVGAVFMSLSTVIVAANAQLLKRSVDLSRDESND